ncbi:MAG: LPS assembly lipoprotein LptE [Rubrivivax sp.]|jgi:LPS-assembly lipoprotein|nr:LPS assembly lipoprotein LptE [Rubrivivax sp.]
MPVRPDAGRRRFVVFGGLAAAGLTGCGFALRKAPAMRFRSIALTGFERGSLLADELRRQLVAPVQIVATPGSAEVVLQALADRRERSVVASTAAAQVRELQLRVRFDFRASTPAGRELIPRTELMLSRDLSFREDIALAKELEEAELVRGMVSDIAGQVLRRLSALVL